MDGYRRSETPTSLHMSGLTGDEPDEFAQQDLPVTESMSTEWTNEKHSLYLKSMEASFVNQLYNSMDVLGWRSRAELLDPRLSQQGHCNPCTPGQFKVLRHGCWQKINFRRCESQSQLNMANESPGVLTSPWFQHFRSARKPQVVPSPSLQGSATSQKRSINLRGKKPMTCGSATSSQDSQQLQYHLCHHDLHARNTEVSDQNFVDEDIEGEKAGSTFSSKRVKTTGASSSDQVVPYGKSPVDDDVTGKCISRTT